MYAGKFSEYNVLDLFCGCGGISLGFQQAGFNIVAGIDYESSAVETYNKNFPNANGIVADLKGYSEEQILELGSIDIVVGGPPCQGFSSANRYLKDKEDPRNALFYEYVRFVKIHNPSVFMICEDFQGDPMLCLHKVESE